MTVMKGSVINKLPELVGDKINRSWLERATNKSRPTVDKLTKEGQDFLSVELRNIIAVCEALGLTLDEAIVHTLNDKNGS